MQINVGAMDRALRMVIGFALMMVIFFVPGPAKWWGFFGIIPFLTGAMGWCPLYLPFRLSTARTRA
jgi:hypothetical protein